MSKEKVMDRLNDTNNTLMNNLSENKNIFLYNYLMKIYDEEIERNRDIDAKAMKLFAIFSSIFTIILAILSWEANVPSKIDASFINAIFYPLVLLLMLFLLTACRELFKTIEVKTTKRMPINEVMEYTNRTKEIDSLYRPFCITLLDVLKFNEKVYEDKEKFLKEANKYIDYSTCLFKPLALLMIFKIFI